MSRAFDRRVEVLIGDERGEGLRFDERFRITFEVTKDREPDGGEASVQIYNVGDPSRDRLIKDGQFVVINCGYADSPMEELFSGDVTRAVFVHDRPDTYLEFELVDGARALRDTRLSLSFAAGTTVQTVLDDILESLDFPVDPSDFQVDGIYQEGVAFSGRARDALQRVAQKGGFIWSIQDGRVQLRTLDDPEVTSVPKITPRTGLIASPERLDDRESETERNAGAGFVVRSLLNPKIRPGQGVVIESRDIDGDECIVDTVSHKGDTRGNEWTTEAEVYETP